MSDLQIRDKVPASYNRAAIHDIVRGIEMFVNTLPRASIGTFTLDADASTTVNDDAVEADSFIVWIPSNAAAASLEAGASKLYLSARTAGASFAVSTADGGNAAGTETFVYVVLNAA